MLIYDLQPFSPDLILILSVFSVKLATPLFSSILNLTVLSVGL